MSDNKILASKEDDQEGANDAMNRLYIKRRLHRLHDKSIQKDFLPLEKVFCFYITCDSILHVILRMILILEIRSRNDISITLSHTFSNNALSSYNQVLLAKIICYCSLH